MQRAINLKLVLFLASAGLLAACQTPPNIAPQSAFVGFFKNQADCREQYAAMDARVEAAGVRDGAFYRVPGYPYLRTDRLLASFAKEVQSMDEVSGWIRRMRELDQESREYEYRNLGLSTQEAAISRIDLLECGRTLAGLEIADEPSLRDLRERVQPPSEYSGLARAAGLYPLTAPLLKSHAEDAQRAAIASFNTAEPLSTEARLWTVKAAEDMTLIPKHFDDAYPDELGMPGLVDSAWRALAEKHAPPILINSAAHENQLGTPVWKDGRIVADAGTPEVHYHFDFVRFGAQALARINYFIWFDDAGADVQGGLDGLIWRVTLDRDTKPLLFESLHASGRDHFWFPAQSLEQRASGGYLSQPPFFPTESLAPSAPVVRLAAESRRPNALLDNDTLAADIGKKPAREYTLQRYEELYMLPRDDGTTRSAFRPDGLMQGATSDGPGWLWISGLQAPGALRQYGHHATSYVGRRVFDDPHLLEQVFVAPPPPKRLKAAQSGAARHSRFIDQSHDNGPS